MNIAQKIWSQIKVVIFIAGGVLALLQVKEILSKPKLGLSTTLTTKYIDYPSYIQVLIENRRENVNRISDSLTIDITKKSRFKDFVIDSLGVESISKMLQFDKVESVLTIENTGSQGAKELQVSFEGKENKFEYRYHGTASYGITRNGIIDLPNLRPTETIEVRIWSFSPLENSLRITHPDGSMTPERFRQFKGTAASIAAFFSDPWALYTLLPMIVYIVFLLVSMIPKKVKIPFEDEGLRLISVQYFSPFLTIDVTEKVKALVKEDSLQMIANNDIDGDPHPGQPKQMRIRYSYNGIVKEQLYNEGDGVKLPI